MELIGDLRQSEDTFLVASGVPKVTLWEQIDGNLQKVGTDEKKEDTSQSQSVATFWPGRKSILTSDS